MTNRKPTLKEYFTEIAEVLTSVNRPDLAEVMESRIEQLDKKNSAERKPTAKQTENEGIKQTILDNMEPNRLYTVGELLKETPGLPEGFTSQRMSALVRQLKEAQLVTRTEVKRVAYFSKATA